MYVQFSGCKKELSNKMFCCILDFLLLLFENEK